jgi:hypothetical protein
VKPTGLENAKGGTKVRVRKIYFKPYLQEGAIGTIQQLYGGESRAAFEVLLPDGRTELFWHHELEEAELAN